MPMKHYRPYLVATLGLIALVGTARLVRSAEQLASVEFLVIDGWGHGVVGDVKISLNPVGHVVASKIVDYPRSKTANLPRGEYIVTTVAKGYTKGVGHLVVYRDNQFVPLSLVVSPIEGPGKSTVVVSGTLSGKYANEASPLWIRMVGVFTDVDQIAAVTTAGAFTFDEIPPGRYMVFVFSRGDLREERQVDVQPFVPTKIAIE